VAGRTPGSPGGGHEPTLTIGARYYITIWF
jgi:hypothetical protein